MIDSLQFTILSQKVAWLPRLGSQQSTDQEKQNLYFKRFLQVTFFLHYAYLKVLIPLKVMANDLRFFVSSISFLIFHNRLHSLWKRNKYLAIESIVTLLGRGRIYEKTCRETKVLLTLQLSIWKMLKKPYFNLFGKNYWFFYLFGL